MRYIGGKSELLDNIVGAIGSENCSVIDIFAGSGAVSRRLAELGYHVISNDLLYFSYIVNRGLISYPSEPRFQGLQIKNVVDYLNDITTIDAEKSKCFIWKNYSLHDGCQRMFFQEKNALRIDMIRQTIEMWFLEGSITEEEYIYLLSRLILAVPYVSNIAGVYAAYLKHWDQRSYKDLTLSHIEENNAIRKENTAYNLNYIELLQQASADVLYADPPYNSRQYLPNYHILETIARYDSPDIYGISGMRPYGGEQKSDFCSKSKVYEAFENLIRLADVGKIIISYNNEGLATSEKLTDLCTSYARPGSFELIQFPYRRYKCNEGSMGGVLEQLFVFRKK